jgi:hypothetical protein
VGRKIVRPILLSPKLSGVRLTTTPMAGPLLEGDEMAIQVKPELAFVDEREAARRYDLSPATMTKWRWAGRGPRFHRFGRRVVYSLADLAEWAEAQAVSSTSDKAR